MVKDLDGRVHAIAYNRFELLAAPRTGHAPIRERKETNEVLERAAILHADVVMIAQPQGDPGASRRCSPANTREHAAAAPRGFNGQQPVTRSRHRQEH